MPEDKFTKQQRKLSETHQRVLEQRVLLRDAMVRKQRTKEAADAAAASCKRYEDDLVDTENKLIELLKEQPAITTLGEVAREFHDMQDALSFAGNVGSSVSGKASTHR